MKKRILVAACLAAVSPSLASAQALDVRLRPVDSPPGERSGMSNLIFEGEAPVTVPAAWDSAEAAILTRVDGRDVWVVRGRSGGAWEYWVDLEGDGDVADNLPLEFRQVENLRVAVVDLPPGAGGIPALRFHVVTADGYVYGRMARSWRGEVRVFGLNVALEVRAASRMEPVAGESGTFELFVDQDGDGELRERSEIRADGSVAAGERIRPAGPFLIGGRAYRLGGVDVARGWLKLVPAPETPAAALGFLAPSLETSTLDGRAVSLEELRGRLVVVEFWSTHCTFSERIRPEVAEMEGRHPDVAWIAVARETDPDAVRAHLADHPMAGEAWMNGERDAIRGAGSNLCRHRARLVLGPELAGGIGFGAPSAEPWLR